MCGRFIATAPVSALAEHFLVEEIKVAEDEVPPRYNVAPTLDVLAVAESRSSGGVRRLGTFRWGLVPSWAKDLTIGSKLINARAESVAEKPAFRKALQRRRCIIPADAFYEWQRPAGGGKNAKKQPFVIRRRDGDPLAFAGLWEAWNDPGDPDAEWVRTCTIVTTTANELVGRLHDRMPVILPKPVWDVWLDTGLEDAAAVHALLVPSPAEDLEAYPVSTEVNDVRNDGPSLADPLNPATIEVAIPRHPSR